ncbi:MAG: hypothetical protein WCG95_03555 [bacterium]
MTEINPIQLQTLANNSQATTATIQANPHNLVNIQTAEEIGDIAKKQIGTMPYRIATAGYSAPPSGYEEPTRNFLKSLDGELGVRSTAFITSPTADKGSIDAITSEVTGMSKDKLFYTTAKDYVEYINPSNFPNTINTKAYSEIPKYVLPDTTEYSKATAKASNIFVATGGRNTTVSDFCNAIKNGNKVIVLDNPQIGATNWDIAKNRVGNASGYLKEQLEAFKAGKALPHPEVGEFTSEFLAKNGERLSKLVQAVTLEGLDASAILKAAKKAAGFIR